MTRVEVYKQVKISPLNEFIKYYESGEITKETIRNNLLNQTKDKVFNQYGRISLWDIKSIIVQMFEYSKKYANLKTHLMYKEETRQTMNVTYKGYTLLYIRVRTVAGESHYDLYSRKYYNDRIISDIEVKDFDGIDNRIETIEKLVAQDELRKNEKLMKQLEIYKQLKQIYPNKDAYDIKHELEELFKNIYTLDKLYKGE